MKIQIVLLPLFAFITLNEGKNIRFFEALRPHHNHPKHHHPDHPPQGHGNAIDGLALDLRHPDTLHHHHVRGWSYCSDCDGDCGPHEKGVCTHNGCHCHIPHVTCAECKNWCDNNHVYLIATCDPHDGRCNCNPY